MELVVVLLVLVPPLIKKMQNKLNGHLSIIPAFVHDRADLKTCQILPLTRSRGRSSRGGDASIVSGGRGGSAGCILCCRITVRTHSLALIPFVLCKVVTIPKISLWCFVFFLTMQPNSKVSK